MGTESLGDRWGYGFPVEHCSGSTLETGEEVFVFSLDGHGESLMREWLRNNTTWGSYEFVYSSRCEGIQLNLTMKRKGGSMKMAMIHNGEHVRDADIKDVLAWIEQLPVADRASLRKEMDREVKAMEAERDDLRRKLDAVEVEIASLRGES
jgi:hypothetical protein